jgi:glycosyltransferase involved in cell wall biosynthesis
MPGAHLVSTIIPTYNRARDVLVAIRSALAQTYQAQEVIVVDDGSTDDTEAVIARAFGGRVRYLRQANAGVSAARNAGMAAARGHYIALLDSDDEWQPEKLAAQVEFLDAHPTYGMVLTDFHRMDSQRRDREVVHRRDAIPEDGNVLRWVVRNPSLAPSTAMFTRAVYEQIGGFDPSLPTAEDIDFHLRVALRYPIGVVERSLTRYMIGHEDGLSALARTYADYMMVVTRFLDAHRHAVPEQDRRAGLRMAYARNARGLLSTGHLRSGLRYSARTALLVDDAGDARELGALGAFILRNLAARLRSAVQRAATGSGRLVYRQAQ